MSGTSRVSALVDSAPVKASEPIAPRTRTRHRRDDLLSAAADTVVRRGCADTRYRDVAEAAGVAVATLQYHFPTLDDLLREAMRFGVRAELELLRRRVEPIDDPWQRLRELIRTVIGTDASRRTGGWQMWMEYWRLASRDEQIAADCHETEAAWLEVAERAIADGIERQLFRTDRTPNEAAVELHALIDGLGIRLARRHDDSRALDAIAIAEHSARSMLLG